ncbi:MAG: TIM barrel protein [Candidatus Njordarchaeota archaeon]
MPKKTTKIPRKKPKKTKKKKKATKKKTKKETQKKTKQLGLPNEILSLLPLRSPPELKLRFAPAGRPIVYKGSVEDAPAFIRNELSLDAYEVQQVRKITLNEERSRILGSNANKSDIVLSIHAPYAVNLLSPEDEKIRASIDRLLATAQIAKWAGAKIIVFHPGYYGSIDPNATVDIVIENLGILMDVLRERKIDVLIGLETMGKLSQFGSLNELIEVVKVFPNARIVFDVAHIHAREKGILMDYNSYDKIFNIVESELGSKHIKNMHIHFTEVEYGDKGEIRHLVIGSGPGPALDPLLEWLIGNNVNATIVCESPILEADAIRIKHRAIEILRKKF